MIKKEKGGEERRKIRWNLQQSGEERSGEGIMMYELTHVKDKNPIMYIIYVITIFCEALGFIPFCLPLTFTKRRNDLRRKDT